MCTQKIKEFLQSGLADWSEGWALGKRRVGTEITPIVLTKYIFNIVGLRSNFLTGIKIDVTGYLFNS